MGVVAEGRDLGGEDLGQGSGECRQQRPVHGGMKQSRKGW